MADENSDKTCGKYTVRDWLALIVTGSGILAVTILALRVGCENSDANKGPGFALITVLPIIGTWVGTVLAFYFSKENFDAASKSVIASAKQVAAGQQLTSVLVTSAMVARDVLHYEQITQAKKADALRLSEIFDRLDAKKVNRMPVLDENNAPLYMIHRSEMDGFVARETLKALKAVIPPAAAAAPTTSAPASDKLTLADFLKTDDAKYRNAFGVVAANATMADAKQEMDKVTFRQDVFVTEKGSAHESILGLITNIEIDKQSRA